MLVGILHHGRVCTLNKDILYWVGFLGKLLTHRECVYFPGKKERKERGKEEEKKEKKKEEKDEGKERELIQQPTMMQRHDTA
jgi:hypothetical protein